MLKKIKMQFKSFDDVVLEITRILISLKGNLYNDLFSIKHIPLEWMIMRGLNEFMLYETLVAYII